MIIEENLDTYFADLGQEVVFNGITKKGLLNMPDEILAGDLMISTDYVLTVQTKQFEDVVLGSILVINKDSAERYIKIVQTITGSTPSFTFSVNLIGVKKYS